MKIPDLREREREREVKKRGGREKERWGEKGEMGRERRDGERGRER